jgi:ClpP class serine protease
MDLINLLWLFIILASLQPALQQRLLEIYRRRALSRLASERGSTVVTLIHRQETMSFLGFPLVRYINIDDAEGVLNAIRATPAGTPIDIVLHTPGGLVLAASQIANALAKHDGPVRAIVPHYAMSGGTLIALAADEINVDPHAALGPVDPQLGEYPAASIIVAAEQAKEPDDRTLILANVGRKAIWQVEHFVQELLERHMRPAQAKEAARILSTGTWTHDHPLLREELEALGLPVKVDVPRGVRELMRLYPQPRGRQSSVEYIPSPRQPREIPASRPKE